MKSIQSKSSFHDSFNLSVKIVTPISRLRPQSCRHLRECETTCLTSEKTCLRLQCKRVSFKKHTDTSRKSVAKHGAEVRPSILHVVLSPFLEATSLMHSLEVKKLLAMPRYLPLLSRDTIICWTHMKSTQHLKLFSHSKGKTSTVNHGHSS